MIDVFKVFYPTHYNIAAISVLLILIIIFLLTKKNYLWSLIMLSILLIFNVLVYKRTDGKSWTITVQPEKGEEQDYWHQQNKTMTFSVKNWKIVDEKGVEHHWCWVEDYWERFSKLDLISAIWGGNVSKEMVQSTETRVNDANQQ